MNTTHQINLFPTSHGFTTWCSTCNVKSGYYYVKDDALAFAERHQFELNKLRTHTLTHDGTNPNCYYCTTHS